MAIETGISCRQCIAIGACAQAPTAIRTPCEVSSLGSAFDPLGFTKTANFEADSRPMGSNPQPRSLFGTSLKQTAAACRVAVTRGLLCDPRIWTQLSTIGAILVRAQPGNRRFVLDR